MKNEYQHTGNLKSWRDELLSENLKRVFSFMESFFEKRWVAQFKDNSRRSIITEHWKIVLEDLTAAQVERAIAKIKATHTDKYRVIHPAEFKSIVQSGERKPSGDNWRKALEQWNNEPRSRAVAEQALAEIRKILRQ